MNVFLQKITIYAWQIFGVKTVLFRMGWADQESFSVKVERLLKVTDTLTSKGHAVSLVGISAGASAALAAFVRRKPAISGIVFICGKLAHPETVNPRYYKENPAFRGAMDELPANLKQLTSVDTQKLLSIRPIYDQTVAVKDTLVSGARHTIIPALYHAPSIAAAITIFSPIAIFFLKKRAKITS